MSKYHPLDVRHPSNRPFLHKNYLLDAPVRAAAETPPSRRAPAARSTATAATPATAPWGGLRRGAAASAGPAGSGSTPVASGGSLGGLLRTLWFLAIIAVIVGSQTDLLDGLIAQAQRIAFDLGLWRP